MAVLHMDNPRFKKAVVLSATVHVLLFLVLLLSPALPNFTKKKTIYYVDYIPSGGGGGGGGGTYTRAAETEEMSETEAPPRQTLKDLTVPERLEQTEPKLRHPVEKPKREIKKKPRKKAVIRKSEPKKTRKTPPVSTGGGSGGGISLGGIGPGSGSGSGAGLGGGSGIGMGNFPYAYYFDRIIDLVASNWYTSQIRAGVAANLQTVVKFRIYRDGSKGSLSVEKSSGVRALDNSAIRAVQEARFPPLPPALEDDFIIIHLVFEHKR